LPPTPSRGVSSIRRRPDALATKAFAVADAMIKERDLEKKGETE